MDLTNERDIERLLKKHGFRFLKSMGQNFLIDGSVPERIASEAGIDGTFGVLEVGPGIGALTGVLSRYAAKVLSVELDQRLLPLLGDTMAEFPNVRILRGDILKLDIGKTVTSEMPGLRYAVCANLPFNITTPVLTALIEAKIFETITVMVQREAALRCCAAPGTADYGAFTVYVKYHAEPEILFDIPPASFIPQPKVTSSAIMLKLRASPPVEIENKALFFRVVRASFAQRRKTLVNSLEAAFGGGFSKEELRQIVTDCGLDVMTRGEALDISGFAAVARRLGEKPV
ncbi:MAG: ribosomal RNA small subunit methyltransferase A [Clostridiales bacterium]|nr:ribosomal RNA small subunit methyltransferase A [Clostridiales bacterium]